MDRQRCVLNPDHLGVFQCGCTAPPASVCAQCLADHMAAPGNHNIASIRSPVLPPRRVPLPGAFVCQMCNQESADEFCCCRFPVMLLCKSCQLSHFQKGVGEAHLFMPAEFKAKMTTLEEVGKLRQSLFNLSDGKGRLMAVVAHITHCQDAMKSLRDRFVQDFSEYVRQQIDELDALKHVLSSEIEKAVEKTREQIFQSQAQGDDLTMMLWKSTKGVCTLNSELFAFQMPDFHPEFDRLLGVSWQSRIDLSGKLAEGFSLCNAFSRKTDITTHLLTRDFPSLSSLSSTCRHEFESLITDEKQLDDAIQRVAGRYYQSHFECLKAKDEMITLEPEQEIGVEAWVAKLIAGYKDKCGRVEPAVVESYISGLRMLAERLYEKGEIRRVNGGDLCMELEMNPVDSGRIANLERIITDFRSKLIEVSKKTEHLQEEHKIAKEDAETARKSLREAQLRIESAPDISEFHSKIAEMSSAFAREIATLKQQIADMQEQSRTEITQLESDSKQQIDAINHKIEVELTARKREKAAFDKRIRESEEKSANCKRYSVIQQSEANLSKGVKAMEEKTQGLLCDLDLHSKSIDQIKHEIATFGPFADQKCRAELKNGENHSDIEEIETFLTAVIAQDKTDIHKKIHSMQVESQKCTRMWSLCGDLISALSRTTVSEEVVNAYEGVLYRLLSEKDTIECAHYLSKNLSEYIRKSPISGKTDDHVVKLLVVLEKCTFDAVELQDSSSVSHILTRPNTLPLDLFSLMEEFRMAEAKPFLAEVRPDQLRTFNCISGIWGKKIVLNTLIRVDHRSSSLFLPSGHIFICGGLAFNEWLSDVYDIDPLSGVAVQLKSMILKRARLGLVLYFNWIYVFGGWAGTPLRSCERYSLTKLGWEMIENDMITPRDYFTPCVYRHFIYLCGGSTTVECERFDVALGKFSPLGFVMPEASFNRAVVLNDELILLSETKLTKRNLLSDSVSQECSHPSYRANGSMTPFVLGSSIYCLSHSPSGMVFCIHANSGELQKEFAYPS